MIKVFPGPTDDFAPGCEAVTEGVQRDAAWVLLLDGDVLVEDAPAPALWHPRAHLAEPPPRVHFLGRLDGRPVLAAEALTAEAVTVPTRRENFRPLAATASPTAWAVTAFASQILHWDRTTRFCGVCGSPTAQPEPTQRAKVCPSCQHSVWPRIAPCTITLIRDDEGRMLLTRQARWPAGRYGLVAGFLEPGETLEACVRREALEETGVAVTDVRYAASQPWPFPHQLMVGFTARATSTEVTLRDGELEDARWFSRDALPILPPRLSIARSLIDAALAGEL